MTGWKQKDFNRVVEKNYCLEGDWMIEWWKHPLKKQKNSDFKLKITACNVQNRTEDEHRQRKSKNRRGRGAAMGYSAHHNQNVVAPGLDLLHFPSDASSWIFLNRGICHVMPVLSHFGPL